MNPLYFGRIYRFDRQAEPVTVSIPFGQGERFIVEDVNDMLAHCTGPDGIAHYKELPPLRRAAATFRLLEAMVHAYRITSGEKYLAAGQVPGRRQRGDRGRGPWAPLCRQVHLAPALRGHREATGAARLVRVSIPREARVGFSTQDTD